MPATSIRDLVIKDDDLVVGTHGRGFWILDDITPLRQLDAAASRRTPVPVQAGRRRSASAGTCTPTRRCRPTSRPGQNPPDGAIIDYWLAADGGRGRARDPRRRAARWCDGTPATTRPSRRSRGATPPTTGCGRISRCPGRGLHRFVWDLHHERPGREHASVTRSPRSWATRRARRWARGRCPAATRAAHRRRADATAPLTVRMDPRVKTPAAGHRARSISCRERSMRRLAVCNRP